MQTSMKMAFKRSQKIIDRSDNFFTFKKSTIQETTTLYFKYKYIEKNVVVWHKIWKRMKHFGTIPKNYETC